MSVEVMPGYKQTEVGAIPEDWSINKIIECADYVDYRGKTPTKASLGILLITAKNIRAGFIDYLEAATFHYSRKFEYQYQRR
ncbi:MAG: hypothetical protein ACREEM_15165 [Blastocatellia bacterium]